MKPKILTMIVAAALGVSAAGAQSVEVFNYSEAGGESGLRLAWRADSTDSWHPLNYDFVKNDFGPWGSHKKMYSPRLIADAATGRWAATWYATADSSVTALATSADLRSWSPQQYYASALDLPRDLHPSVLPIADSAMIGDRMYAGYRQSMSKALVDSLQAFVEHRRALDALYGETAAGDAERFACLGTVKVRLAPTGAPARPISDMLIGIFFEDINYGADGGLYAELVQNRDFEYSNADRHNWKATTAWHTDGEGTLTIDTATPLHPANPHYACIDAKGRFTVSNTGYDSIAVVGGESYRFSIAVSAPRPTGFDVCLVSNTGKLLAKKTMKVKGDGWQRYTAVLKAGASASNARLELRFAPGTRLDIDMVSLFPEKTFKGRENGLRADLAQHLADLKPRFVRFPGGCVAHGNGIDNIYDWKGSIGPLEARKPLYNLWGYHQTRGLGYYEYFLFCEDIGAEPLPVLAAGVPCQNSGRPHEHSTCALDTYGQQGGIAWDDMPAYVQDILDLIEYANGPADSEWGSKRAAAGHPEPFNLKYIGIGNEDMITEVFEPRFKMIFDAVREAHPEITVVGTVGPFYEGTDYERGWQIARELEVPIVDEHYYVSPGWLIYNRDYYDSYPRGGTRVYLGEYASHLPGRPNNLETALSDALYLTDVERNGDVVAMTSYAPLLAKRNHTQWNPDMIYFDNTSVHLTPEYHSQAMFGNNSGTAYVPTELTIDSSDPKVKARVGCSVVTDEATGENIVKMVNMLPVHVEIDLAAYAGGRHSVKALQLTGAPDDENAATTDVTLALPTATLPPYSFTLFRVKGR